MFDKEVRTLEVLKNMLEKVPDTYDAFVVAVLVYVKNKESRLEEDKSFVEANSSALSSDILEFISDQDDFYNDATYGT